MTDRGDPPSGYDAPYRVRFDEAGPDGRLRTSGLLRYTQDLAAQHSEALGYDRAWYTARGLTWIVRTAELDIEAPIPYGASVVGTTRVVGFRRVWSRRESTFTIGGRRVAVVRIDWVLLSDRGSPARIPAEFETIFPTARPAVALRLGRVSLDASPALAFRRAIDVRPQELDPLDHVNNAVYADWLDEAIAAAEPLDGGAVVRALPRRVRIEYALAAESAERLEIATWPDRRGWSCRIARAADAAELLRARLEPGPPAEAFGEAG